MPIIWESCSPWDYLVKLLVVGLFLVMWSWVPVHKHVPVWKSKMSELSNEVMRFEMYCWYFPLVTRFETLPSTSKLKPCLLKRPILARLSSILNHPMDETRPVCKKKAAPAHITQNLVPHVQSAGHTDLSCSWRLVPLLLWQRLIAWNVRFPLLPTAVNTTPLRYVTLEQKLLAPALANGKFCSSSKGIYFPSGKEYHLWFLCDIPSLEVSVDCSPC